MQCNIAHFDVQYTSLMDNIIQKLDIIARTTTYRILFNKHQTIKNSGDPVFFYFHNTLNSRLFISLRIICNKKRVTKVFLVFMLRSSGHSGFRVQTFTIGELYHWLLLKLKKIRKMITYLQQCCSLFYADKFC